MGVPMPSRLVIGILGSAILLSACADSLDRSFTAPPDSLNADRVESPPPAAYLPGPEEVRGRLAEQVQSFSGYYLSGDTLVVQSVAELAPSPLGLIRASLGPNGRRVPFGRVRAEIVRHRWRSLADWQQRLLEYLHAVEGAHSIGIRNRTNTIVVDVSDSAAGEAVEALAVDLGIPLDAVEIGLVPSSRPTGPSAYASSTPSTSLALNDYIRPLVGGLVATRSWDGPGKGCTIGFLAARNGSEGFVTSSHCTNTDQTIGDGIGANFYEPEPSSAYYVGEVTVDPNFRFCSGFRWCRYSDAAFVKIDRSYTTLSRGYIARPVTIHSNEILSTDPTFEITGDGYGPSEGERVYMVGVATGLSSGFVDRSCVRLLLKARVDLNCQFAADYESADGDSGGPVFRWPDVNRSEIELLGIHRSNTREDGYVHWQPYHLSYGSHFYLIEWDLGDLAVTPTSAPPGGGTPPAGCIDPNTGDPIPC